jgi:hypothetical protein
VKEAEMFSIPVRCCAASRFALALLLILGASGCAKQPRVAKKTKPIPCDTTVNVDATVGAQPTAVYLCEDDTLTWNANGHQFVVEFKKDSPFEPPTDKKFDNGHPSGKAKHYYSQLTVYEYRITVDGHPFDPEVIGGGNP